MSRLDIKFLGGIADREKGTSIGGSCQFYEYTYGTREQIARVLLDMGSFVGMDPKKAPDQMEHFDPDKLDAVIITHMHNDHVGRIAELVKRGYRGPIYMTGLSAKLLPLILEDSLKIQRAQVQKAEEFNDRIGSRLRKTLKDTKCKKRKPMKRSSESKFQLLKRYNVQKEADIKGILREVPEGPKFDENDILQTIKQIKILEYGKQVELVKDAIYTTFLDAGHVAGSAQVLMKFKERKNGNKRLRENLTLLNTGDLGRHDSQLLCNPPAISKQRIGATIIEGTYGGRNHSNRQEDANKLLEGIKSAEDICVIPAFSLQRFQEIMYVLHQMVVTGELKFNKGEKIYCSSPLAWGFSQILMAEDPERYGFLSDSIFHLIQGEGSVAEKERILAMPGRKIIIAGGGMIQGGSSVSYVLKALTNSKAQIRFTGYQAEGTLGRKILEAYGTGKLIPIGETEKPVRAQIHQLKSFSSHADEPGLVRHMQESNLAPKGHQTIITHGGTQREDVKSAMQSAGLNQTRYILPNLGDTVRFNFGPRYKKVKIIEANDK